MLDETDPRLRKYLQGLAAVRGLQRQVSAAHWELEQKLADLEKRLDALQQGAHEPLLCETFGKPSTTEAKTSPRWLN